MRSICTKFNVNSDLIYVYKIITIIVVYNTLLPCVYAYCKI